MPGPCRTLMLRVCISACVLDCIGHWCRPPRATYMTQRSEGELAFATAPTGTLQKMLASITCLRLCRKVRARGAQRHECCDDVIQSRLNKNCREDPRSNSKARPNLHQFAAAVVPSPGRTKRRLHFGRRLWVRRGPASLQGSAA